MIAAHQPTIFPNELLAGLTDISDGNFGINVPGARESADAVREKRNQLFGSVAATLVYVTYKDDNGDAIKDFCRYGDADQADNIDVSQVPHDALVTKQPDKVLFLPLADCVGTILYDTHQKICMVSHLGRHSIEQRGAYHSVKYLEESYGSRAEDILVWLSPAAGKTSYPLYAFANRSLHEELVEQLITAGVSDNHIEVSNVDTTLDQNYFSQSEFTRERRKRNGRFIIYAQMRT